MIIEILITLCVINYITNIILISFGIVIYIYHENKYLESILHLAQYFSI